MTRVFRAAGCALFLCACSTTSGDFEKRGASKEEAEQDFHECELRARNTGYFGEGLVGDRNIREFTERCMKVRGWTRK